MGDPLLFLGIRQPTLRQTDGGVTMFRLKAPENLRQAEVLQLALWVSVALPLSI